MPKSHPPYAPEFRRQMIELVRAGRDPADLAREFEPSAQAIRNWVAQDGTKRRSAEVVAYDLRSLDRPRDPAASSGYDEPPHPAATRASGGPEPAGEPDADFNDPFADE